MLVVTLYPAAYMVYEYYMLDSNRKPGCLRRTFHTFKKDNPGYAQSQGEVSPNKRMTNNIIRPRPFQHTLLHGLVLLVLCDGARLPPARWVAMEVDHPVAIAATWRARLSSAIRMLVVVWYHRHGGALV